MSDLDDLARAASQPEAPLYRPTRVAYVSATPARRPKPPSPFAWGFFVTLGVIVAVLAVIIGLAAYGRFSQATILPKAPASQSPSLFAPQIPAGEARENDLDAVANAITYKYQTIPGYEQLWLTNTSSSTVHNLHISIGGRTDTLVGTILPKSEATLDVSRDDLNEKVEIIDGWLQ
jgi:hypothetical protein